CLDPPGANRHFVTMAPQRKIITLTLVGAVLLTIGFCIFKREPPQDHPTPIPAQLAAQPQSLAAARPQPQAALGHPASPTPTSFPADSPMSSHPVERAVSAGTVLDARLERLASGAIKRTRLLKSALLPHLLRVEEEWADDSSVKE